MIDVLIVPSKDPEAIRGCVASVHAARGAMPFEVLAMDLAGAVALHPDRDIVLLDPAIRVVDGWLDRLAACARREVGVATVSPFANAAALCSYPRLAASCALPEGMSAAELAALFAAENADESLDIPTAEASCVYVTRAALEAAGTPEPHAMALFCERASAAGLRHVLCADAFVHHTGTVAPMPLAGDDTLEAFAAREPMRPARRRVDLARLRGAERPLLLCVTHRWGGGVERHVQDLARLAGDECEVLCLRPEGPDVLELRWLREGEDFQAWFQAADWEEGVALLASLGIARIHFHHVHGLPRAVLDLPAALGVPYDATLHDYYPVCPRYHLSPAEGQSCAGCAEACDRCLEAGPAQWGLTLAQWRATFHGFLRDAARVIAPSQDVATRLRRQFADVPVNVWPHPEFPRALPAVFKVVLLGAVSAIKGARLLEACVADAAARRLPLHFHVIGSVDRPMATLPAAPLTIGGSYTEETLGLRLALERPDAILFLSQVAETYSYTLSAAMQTGLPIIATRAGAFSERLRGYQSHVLLPLDAPAAAVNDALLARLARAALVRPAAV